jgi:CopG family nickel-responsive transcriptional regulator
LTARLFNRIWSKFSTMKDPLVRFGVAVEAPLLEEFDALVKDRRCTRSELLRDLARAEVGRAKVRSGAKAVATLTIVYDHHVRDLSEKLTELQHDLGDRVRATLHVHLNHDLCLEVIVLRGRADELQTVANRILATRGVRHGGIEIISESGPEPHEHAHSPARPSDGETGSQPRRRKSADGHTPPAPAARSKARKAKRRLAPGD